MKANRKFRQADEAVSPVIAVILMVAITVVLAATVFVLVSDIGGNTSQSAPAVTPKTDDQNDKLVIDAAASGADWNRLAIKLKSITVAGTAVCMGNDSDTTYQNEANIVDCDGTGDTNRMLVADTAPTEITGASDPINANDYVELCGSVAATDVVVTLIDTTANAVIGDYTFLTLALCSAG